MLKNKMAVVGKLSVNKGARVPAATTLLAASGVNLFASAMVELVLVFGQVLLQRRGQHGEGHSKRVGNFLLNRKGNICRSKAY